MLFRFTFFFLWGLSFTDNEDSQDSRGREKTVFYSTLPLLPLTNIQKFIWNFACEITITYFQSHRLYLPDCYSTRLTILSNYHLIDCWCEVSFCLFTWWFDSSFFVTSIWDGKPVDSNTHRLSPLYYKQTEWPSVLVTPKIPLRKLSTLTVSAVISIVTAMLLLK